MLVDLRVIVDDGVDSGAEMMMVVVVVAAGLLGLRLVRILLPELVRCFREGGICARRVLLRLGRAA